ncbi:MAG TPA: spore germination protein GerW family protein [Thermomicrobiales bacterium]|nr:spore germination protein GerW family protein [Thermomicrobiales bacterium]
MDVQELLAQARDAMTVQRVFGEPIEKDGVTVIPVAKVAGGGGGGIGQRPGEGQPGQGGAGYGLQATPAGVYMIKEGRVSWQPAVDVNRVILGGQIVAVVLILAIRAIIKARAARDDD